MATTKIPAELVAVNAIQGTLIADNAITAVHIATNAISGTLVADNAITSTHIAQNNVTATQIAQNTITVTQMADSAIETAKINNNAVTQAKIADDAVGPDQLAANAVVTGSIANGTIIEADMGDNAITLAKMASLARGKIIVGDSAGDPSALAIGSNGTVLSSDGTDVSWAAASGGVDGIVSNANATAITIDSSERVGINTTSPATAFELNGVGFINASGSSTGRFVIRNSTTGEESGGIDIQQIGLNAEIYNDSNGYLRFGTNNAEQMRIDSSGNLQIKTSSAASSNSVSLPGYIEFKGQGWDSNSGSDDMNAKIEMAATYGKVGSGATSPELVFSLQGAGGLDSSSESYVEGMRLVGAGANNGNQPRLGIGTTTPGNLLDVTHSAGAHTPVLRLTGASTSGYAAGLEWWSGYGPKQTAAMYSTASGSQGGEWWLQVRNQSSNTLITRMGIDNVGNVRIGAAKKFYLDGGGDTYIDEYSANEVGITTGGSRKFALSGGNLYHAGSHNPNHNFSDIRLKENIVVIPNALEKVSSLRGITFTRKTDGSVGTGLIAQELEKVLPEAVYESKTIDSLEDPDAEEYKAINYPTTVGLLVEAIKEQQTIIDALTARLTAGGL